MAAQPSRGHGNERHVLWRPLHHGLQHPAHNFPRLDWTEGGPLSGSMASASASPFTSHWLLEGRDGRGR